MFTGKVVLVTGAGSGIGRASARVFAERGADVLVQDINPTGAEETAELVRETGRRAQVSTDDVADVEAIRQTVAECSLGAIDILVNNAGIPSDRCPIEDVSEAMFERTFAVHVKGTLFTTQAVIPGMKARGGERSSISLPFKGFPGLRTPPPTTARRPLCWRWRKAGRKSSRRGKSMSTSSHQVTA